MKIEAELLDVGDKVCCIYQHQEDSLWKYYEVGIREIRTLTDHRRTLVSYGLFGVIGWTDQALIFPTRAEAAAECEKRNA